MKTKEQLIDRWGHILRSTINRLPKRLKQYNDPEQKDYKDRFGSFVANDYRTIGKLEYLLNNKADEFKVNIENSTEYVIELFELYEKGNPVDKYKVSMGNFVVLLGALASGNIELSKRLAGHMGGRPEIEKKEDDDFEIAIGYSLKYFAEGDVEKAMEWIPKLYELCANKYYRNFIGYPMVLEALSEDDVVKANEAFKVLVEGHKRQCNRNREPNYGLSFYDSPDADLFVWGIGLANLCRYYGLDVKIDDPIMPDELIIRINKG